jgi:hypothetical protein
MLRRVDLVRTDVSIRVTLMMEAILFSETSDLTRATRRNIPEDTIVHSHRHENLKSYREFVLPFLMFIISVAESNKTIIHYWRA